MASGVKFLWVRGDTYEYTVYITRGGAPLDITGYRLVYKAVGATTITKDSAAGTITILPGTDGICTFSVTSAETAAQTANKSPAMTHEMKCKSPLGVVKRVFEGTVSVDESLIGAL